MARSKQRSGASSTATSNGATNGEHAADEHVSNGVAHDETMVETEAAEEGANPDDSIDESEGVTVPDIDVDAAERDLAERYHLPTVEDVDPAETDEWLESVRYVLESKGPERVNFLLAKLDEMAHREG